MASAAEILTAIRLRVRAQLRDAFGLGKAETAEQTRRQIKAARLAREGREYARQEEARQQALREENIEADEGLRLRIQRRGAIFPEEDE